MRTKHSLRHFFAKKWRTKTSVYALTGYAATSKSSLNCAVRHNFTSSRGVSRSSLNNRLLSHAIERINNRPRKCLGFRTAKEVFQKENAEASRPCSSGALKGGGML